MRTPATLCLERLVPSVRPTCTRFCRCPMGTITHALILYAPLAVLTPTMGKRRRTNNRGSHCHVYRTSGGLRVVATCWEEASAPTSSQQPGSEIFHQSHHLTQHLNRSQNVPQLLDHPGSRRFFFRLNVGLLVQIQKSSLLLHGTPTIMFFWKSCVPATKIFRNQC